MAYYRSKHTKKQTEFDIKLYQLTAIKDL